MYTLAAAHVLLNAILQAMQSITWSITAQATRLAIPPQSRHLRLPLSAYDESTRVQRLFFGIADFIHSLFSFLRNAV